MGSPETLIDRVSEARPGRTFVRLIFHARTYDSDIGGNSSGTIKCTVVPVTVSLVYC